MQPNSFGFFAATIGAWVIFYNIAFQILLRKIPVPSKIALEKNPNRRRSEYCSNVASHLSLFHALVSLVVSCYIYLNRPFFWLEANQPDSIHLLCFSAGYYISTTIIGRVYRFHPISMLFHHLVVLLQIFYSFHKGIFCNIVVVGFAIAEASNPFRIVKNISDGHLELKRLGDLCIQIFAVVFLFCRWPHQPHPVLRAARVRPNPPHPAGSKNVRRGVV